MHFSRFSRKTYSIRWVLDAPKFRMPAFFWSIPILFNTTKLNDDVTYVITHVDLYLHSMQSSLVQEQ